MSKIIFNCRSLFARKNILKCNFSHDFSSSKELLKIKNYQHNISKNIGNKININKKDVMSIKFDTYYNKNIFKLKINNNALEKNCENYDIKNEIIKNNIKYFYDLTSIYINSYIEIGENYIKNNIYTIFTILKFHENNILTIDEFSKKNMKDIFTKELLYKLEFI